MNQRRDADQTGEPPIVGEPLIEPPDLGTLGGGTPETSAPAGAGVDTTVGGATEVGGDGPGRAAQVKDAAASAAGDAASTAGDEVKRVAAEATSQARSVVDEVKGQASGLLEQTRDELRAQADTRSTDAAGALRTLSDQLQALGDGRPGEAGPLAGYLDEARGQVSGFATRLESDGFEGLVSDVSNFARRRPGLFILATAGTGFLVGRLARSGARAGRGEGSKAGPIGELAPMDPIVAAPTTLADPSDPVMPSTTGVVVP